jgi:hypothetical protein
MAHRKGRDMGTHHAASMVNDLLAYLSQVNAGAAEIGNLARVE